MDEVVLIEISKYLKPKRYKKDDIIIEEDKPLEMMIFIVDGHVSIEKRGASNTFRRDEGQLYGEQVLCWPAWASSAGMSHESVRALGDVDVLVLMASDMEHVGCKFRSKFGKEINLLSDPKWHLLSDPKWQLLETDRVKMLRKVSKLETMDNLVLEAISQLLKAQTYNTNLGSRLMTWGQPVREMIMVAEGQRAAIFEEYIRVSVGQHIVGEEILDWVLDSSFPALLPLSKHAYIIKSTEEPLSEHDYIIESTEENEYLPKDDVEMLILTAEDLASVVSEYRSHFSRVVTQTTDLFAHLTFTRLKGVQVFEDMDEEVLKEISKHMKHMSYSCDTVIIDKYKPLEMMFLVLDGAIVTVDGGRFSYQYVAGDLYGFELAYWIKNWGLHVDFPAKLPLSHNSARVVTDDSHETVEVAVLWADDLKRIVCEFRPNLMKQTAIPMDSEGKPATLDPMTMVKKVRVLENMNEDVLKAICSHLKPMKYSDDSPDGPLIFKKQKFDKMFFITRGVVSSVSSGRTYCYYRSLSSGDYFGEELLKWVLDASVNKEPKLPIDGAYYWVGEVEASVLMAEDLAKVISKFETHFVRQISPAFLMDSD